MLAMKAVYGDPYPNRYQCCTREVMRQTEAVPSPELALAVRARQPEENPGILGTIPGSLEEEDLGIPVARPGRLGAHPAAPPADFVVVQPVMHRKLFCPGKGLHIS